MPGLHTWRCFISSLERKTIIICPVKNESWILETFLAAAQEVADFIIIGDHFSTDDSVSIAMRNRRAVVVEAQTKDFSEAGRRNQLMSKAREFGLNNLIIALDADEILSPKFFEADYLSSLKAMPIGTRFVIPHLNIRPGFESYWRVKMAPIAFIDDGSLHDEAQKIHFPRIPLGHSRQVHRLRGQGILHFQYVDWARMESKHRWYRIWERINYPNKSQLEIYRRYNHMYLVPQWKLRKFPKSWLSFYAQKGIDLLSIGSGEQSYWWDDETRNLIASHRGLDFSLLISSRDQGSLNPGKKQREFAGYLKLTGGLASLSWFLPVRLLLKMVDLANRKRFM